MLSLVITIIIVVISLIDGVIVNGIPVYAYRFLSESEVI